MTLKGSIEHRYTNRHVFQETFVNLYNFLNSTCSSIGVTRIAYNSGSAGTGMDYWDGTSPTGNNAWATFKFNSATTPFYVLIQYTESATFGSTPGNPGLRDAVNTNYGLAVSFALNSDGTTPWNGTTLNNGSDAKGSSVWKVGAGGVSRLYTFPRSNYSTGSHATNRENMMTLMKSSVYSQPDFFNMTTEGGHGAVSHFFADENNLLLLTDPGALGNYNAIWFGPYTARNGITADVPLACLGWYTDSTDRSPFNTGVSYGALDGTVSSTNFQGGMLHPQSMNGVRTCKALLNTLFFQSRYHPNKATGLPSKLYDLHRPQLVLYEEPVHFGYVGYVDFFKMGWGMPSSAVSADGLTAAFNLHFAYNYNRVWNTYLKIIVPWDSAVQPYSLTSRLGHQFSR